MASSVLMIQNGSNKKPSSRRWRDLLVEGSVGLFDFELLDVNPFDLLLNLPTHNPNIPG